PGAGRGLGTELADHGAVNPDPAALDIGVGLAPRAHAALRHQFRNSYGFHHRPYSAATPLSPVRMRIACSMGVTKILPAPILPVLADSMIAWMVASTWASPTAISSFSLGRKSTTYSAPRYSSV